MTPGVSLVCLVCKRANPLDATRCEACNTPLNLVDPSGAAASAAAPAAAAPAPAPGTAVMTAASGPAAASGPIICSSCSATVPPEYKFCGRCGTRVPEPVAAPAPAAAAGSRTQFFGAMQVPGKAKLILIKGEGLDGVSYHLNATEHVAGRLQGVILFPEDPLMSPSHANFFYKDAKLWLRDESSVNGVFIRIREPVDLMHQDHFLVGEQLLRFETCEDTGPQVDDAGTFYYSSPKRPSAFRLVQILRGGDVGLSYRARGEAVSLGREGNDIDFPTDQFISGRHAQVQALGNRFVLSDIGSKNGTFVRLSKERALNHGDYVFIGQQLLRVEIT
jgi:pSer/pThr/pTyr-binding forkhead associated (FHA) protein